jgi:hypothetical protein
MEFQFVNGLAQLKGLLGAIMGDPVEPEHGLDAGCDTQQLTTTGLAYWRCASGTLGFVAFPDGMQHWAWTPGGPGVLTWTGEPSEPPADALLTSPMAGDATPPACPTTVDDTLIACPLASGEMLTGYLGSPGATNAYPLDVGPNGALLDATLGGLPADYDLYLVDGQKQVVAASSQEGLAPESIELPLGFGTYYVYVHSDPGRDVAPDESYQLVVSLTEPFATAAEPAAAGSAQ